MGREALREAQQGARAATRHVQETEEMVTRARALVKASSQTAANKSFVEGEITKHRVKELREGSPPGELPAYMVEAKKRVDEAVASLQSTQAALESLEAELVTAQEAERQELAAVEQAAISVLREVAEDLALQLRRANAYRDGLQKQLLDVSNMHVTPAQPQKDPFGRSVLSVSFPMSSVMHDSLWPQPQVNHIGNPVPWQNFLARLQVDADATLS